MLRVFLSYSRRDGEFARRLAAALDREDIEAWTDWNDIPPSAEWMTEVLGAIENSHAFVFVLSPDSAASRVCAIEVSHAVKHNKRIVIALRRETDVQDLPERIAQIQWIPFVDDYRFDDSVVHVRKAVETNADWLRRHTTLTMLASLWEKRGRDRGSLLRGEPLSDAERSLDVRSDETQPVPSPLVLEYIADSRRNADENTAKNAVFAVQSMLQRRRVLGADALLREAERLLSMHAIGFLPARIARWQLDSLKPVLSGSFAASGASADVLGWIPWTADFIVAGRTAVQRRSSIDGTVIWTTEFSAELGNVLAIAGGVAAVARCDGAIALLDLKGGTQGASWHAHDDVITSLAFTGDGDVLVSGGFDASVRSWRVPGGALLREMTGHSSPVAAVAVSPDGTLFASGSYGMNYNPQTRSLNLVGHHVDKTVRIWLAATGRQLVAPDFELGIRYLAFLAGGRRVLAFAINPFNGLGLGFQVWDAHTGALLQQFGKDSPPMAGLGISGDCSVVASADRNGLHVWDVGTGQTIVRGELGAGAVDAVIVNDDGRLGVTAEKDGTLHVWDLRGGGRRCVMPITTEGDACAFAISADAHYLAAGAGNRLEDIGSEKFMRESAEGLDYPIRIMDLESGLELRQLHYHRRGLEQLAFLPDSSGLVSVDEGGTIVQWDLQSGEVMKAIAAQASGFSLSPNGRWLLLRSTTLPARLVTLADWQIVHEFPEAKVRAVVFSEDSTRAILITENGQIVVYEAASGRQLRTETVPGADWLRGLTVRRGQLLCGCGSVVQRWDLETGESLRAIVGTEGMAAYTVSSDGAVFALALEDGPLRLLDAETSQVIAEFEGAEAAVRRLAFASDDSALVAGGDDGKLRVWLFSKPSTAASIGALGVSRHALAAISELDRVHGSAEFPALRRQLWFNALRAELAGELADAVERRDVPRIDALLATDATLVKRIPGTGLSAIQLAAESGAADLVQRLLTAGAPPDLRSRDGFTALHYAAGENRAAVVELLIAAQASVNAASDVHRLTPLHLAAKRGHLDMVRTLIGHGADLEAQTDDGWTPLHESIEASDWIVEALLKAGANANASTVAGYTPLHRAALMDKTAAVALLLDARATIGSADREGVTALHFAASRAGARTIDLLLRMGADPRRRDHAGKLPLDHAVEKNNGIAVEHLRPVSGTGA